MIIGLPATAQFAQKLPAPIQQRGYKAVGTFQETVNLFSGNVNLAIPIASLPSGGEFVFNLTLFYDSNVWIVGPGEPYNRTSEIRPSPFRTYDGLDPTAGAFSWNVSPGWLLHPGRIVETDPGTAEGAHFIYFGPDHSAIPLYDKLHGSDPDESGGAGDAFYSRDGSYLKFVSDDGPTGTLYASNGVETRFSGGWFLYTRDTFGNRVDKVMEFPEDPLDEVVMVFRENRYSREIRVGLEPSKIDCGQWGTCVNPNLGLVRWVEYQAPGLDGQGNPNTARVEFNFPQWELELPEFPEPPDFCNVNSPNYDVDLCRDWIDENWPIPETPPAFCDVTDPSYDFDTCFRWRLDQGEEFLPWRRHLATVPPYPDCPLLECWGRMDDLFLWAGGFFGAPGGPLSGITFPDGTAYRFKYGKMSEVDGGPPGMLSGAISELGLPTGGTITYTYGEFKVPDNRRDDLRYGDAFDEKDFWAPQMGVIGKKYFDVGKDPALNSDSDPNNDVEPDHELRYRRGIVDAGNIVPNHYLDQAVVVNSGEASRQRDMFVVVTSALGHETVHFFRTPERAWDYGLPFTRAAGLANAFPARGGGDIRQAYLSQEVFEGPAVVNGQKGNLKRQHFLAYERDIKTASEGFRSPLNARVFYRREVFHDDLNGGIPRYKESLSSSFDGYGHYRQVARGGNFSGSSEMAKTLTTDFNNGTGDYIVFESTAGGDDEDTFSAGTGHSFMPRGNASPWILNTFGHVTVSGDGQTARSEFHFNPNNGLLERTRTLANFGTSRAANDIVVQNIYDAHGHLTESKTFGGDVQNNLALGTLGNLNLSALTPEYWKSLEITETGDRIILEQQQIEPDTGSVLLMLYRSEIETHTGLVLKSVDSAGIEVAHTYDSMLRRTRDNADGEVGLVTTYQPATATSGPRSTTTKGTIESFTQYDGFGRPTQHGQQFPQRSGKTLGESVARINTIYENGVSVRQTNPFYNDDLNPGSTVYLNHDFEARPTKITHADNKDADLTFVGDRVRTSTLYVADAWVAGGIQEQPATTTLELDLLGRLVGVTEAFESAQDTAHTSYRYNVHDALTGVTQGVQNRSFTYDNRGFLLTETHPENGTTSYGGFNTKGLATIQTAQDGHELYFTYDPLGRLVSVSESDPGNPGQDRVLKDFFYGNANVGSNKVAGKIWQSRRFNYPDGSSAPVIVTKSYFYQAEVDGTATGRLSHLRVRTNTGQAFEQAYTYDNKGFIIQMKHPAMRVGDAPDSIVHRTFGAEAQRTLDFNRERGFLKNIPGVINGNITYHPHRYFAKSIPRNNGLTDVFEQAGDETIRPSRISVVRPNQSNLWTQGPYAYDGAGNIAAIGNDFFLYDRSGRLKEAEIGLVNQTFDYDRFGNITALAGTSLNVDSNNNRLKGANRAYDGRGNLIRIGNQSFDYDGLGLIARAFATNDPSDEEHYIYDADDLRLAIYHGSGQQLWTVRSPAGKLLKEYVRAQPEHRLKKTREYAYADDRLVAAWVKTSAGIELRHHHGDHLGSMRLVTDPNGQQVVSQDYNAFGSELSPDNGEVVGFTGHERDADNQVYMKARTFLPDQGRFTSPDPILGSADAPQSWNRYAYVQNNPVNAIDPTGEAIYIIYIPAYGNIIVVTDSIDVYAKAPEPLTIESPGERVRRMLEAGSEPPSISAFDPKRHRIISDVEQARRDFLNVSGMGPYNRQQRFILSLVLASAGHPPSALVNPRLTEEVVPPEVMAGELTYELLMVSSPSVIKANARSPYPGSVLPPNLPHLRVEVGPMKRVTKQFYNSKGIEIENSSGRWRVKGNQPNGPIRGSFSKPPTREVRVIESDGTFSIYFMDITEYN